MRGEGRRGGEEEEGLCRIFGQFLANIALLFPS